MTRNRRENIISRAETLYLNLGETLSMNDGSRRDCYHLFVKMSDEVDGERFFRDLSWEYDHR